MKMKFTTLSACLLASFMTCAVPVAPIVKGVATVWDEVAKVALKISGKEATKDSVKATAGNLSKIAKTQGDDASRLAAKGGVEAVEKSVALGLKFTRMLMKSAAISDDAIKYATRHSDDVLKYSAKYGDDVIIVNAKAPGLSGRLIKSLDGCPVQPSLKAMAKLPKEELPRAIVLLEKCENAAKIPYLDAIQKDGAGFVDKLIKLDGRQIMAAGVSASMIIGVTGGAIAGNKMANGAVAPSLATAKNVSQNNEWAERVLNDPNSQPEAKEEAKRILWQNHQRADAGKWTFRIIAVGTAGLILLLGVGLFMRISCKSK